MTSLLYYDSTPYKGVMQRYAVICKFPFRVKPSNWNRSEAFRVLQIALNVIVTESQHNDASASWTGSFGDQRVCIGALPNKRLSNGLSAVMSDCLSSCSERSTEPPVKKEATPEESERRKRRRERNKIAAAKCRNKKKEKTDGLQKESEKLESINAELKAQIEELKSQKQQLVYMLNLHRPTCIVRAQNGQTPEDERNLFIQQIKEGTLQSLMAPSPALTYPLVPTSCGSH
ncbi:hypothetical protein ANANG_G00116620 [Anguilla anguilla]|uniref:BZIP domain-containing protein n=1 Tax=Anguilla anguilla TaxID=7936 RepID=A0A9D3MEP3_ANGAN|nr:hypothetical protein ANANG_G00116620 [Anguilla anguilla]